MKKQFIEITGNNVQVVGSTFKSFVEVATIFTEALYPETLQDKDIEFVVDNTIC